VQGTAVYQRHYGLQIRRTLQPKTTPPSKTQTEHRTLFQAALTWRATLTNAERQFLEAHSITSRIVDSYGVPLSWDKYAMKIALEKPIVTIVEY
jgi:hypothetical protein